MKRLTMIEKTCCVTGHRQIPADKLAYVHMELKKAIMSAVADGYTRFINGGAAGADLLFAAQYAAGKGKTVLVIKI